MIDEKMLVQMRKLNRAIMIAFVILGGTLAYWSVMRAQSILAREDNPRLVDAELRIQRGQILDRNDTVVATTTGPADALEREYPIPSIGPAVGYYSFRHGTAGIEESYDLLLRGEIDDFWGEFLRQSLHRTQAGRDIRLTLDARLQSMAATLDQGQDGAALLLALPRAEILAMASFPSYDPNQLDERFQELSQDEGAPLLNRVTQGQYQPGLVLQPLILAAALDQALVRLNVEVPDISEPGTATHCSTSPPSPATWADTLVNQCPGPMADLAEMLDTTQLEQIFAEFGLTTTPSLPLNTETPELETLNDARLAGIGQDNLLVTPLQMGLAWAVLGLDGRIPSPRLVEALQDEMGQWQENMDEPAELRSVVSPSAANGIRRTLPLHEDTAEFQTLVLSGPEGNTHAWYLGLAPADSPEYAVVVILEDSTATASAALMGRALLDAALP
jgi:peptidoglycan glycosyltransferase